MSSFASVVGIPLAELVAVYVWGQENLFTTKQSTPPSTKIRVFKKATDATIATHMYAN